MKRIERYFFDEEEKELVPKYRRLAIVALISLLSIVILGN